jgi:glyoxylase-like metal-dependent hydrolase (beta-lactamase superfamily II)
MSRSFKAADDHSGAGLTVEHVVTGPNTNCYLIYDPEENSAALIDVAGPIEPLLSIVRSEDLNIRFFLFTHGHFDHLLGLSHIRHHFPEALVCMHRLDYNDMPTQLDWVLENLDPDIISWIRNDPEASKLLEFDWSTFGEPDLFITDGMNLSLGRNHILVLHSPGHSPGSVCYYVGGKLFSGDVLFRDSVGRVDVQNSSREDQIQSVRRLYRDLPETTPVYPGHGDRTTLGREMFQNAKISIHAVNLT